MGDKFRQAMAGKAPIGTPEAPQAPPAPAAAPEAPKAPVAAPAAPASKDKPLVPDFKTIAPPPAPTPPEPAQPNPDAKETPEPAPGSKEFNFQQLEQKYKETQAKLVELEKRAATPVVPPDYEALKTEREELSRKLSTYELTNDPMFREAFNQKQKVQVDFAKNAVGPEKAGEIEEILSMKPGGKREKLISELAEDLEQVQMTALVTAYQRFQELEIEKNQEISNAPETMEKIKARRTEAAAQQAQAERNQRLLFADQELNIAANTWEEFRPKIGDDAHNKAVAENQAMVRSWCEQGTKPDAFSKIATWAVFGIRAADSLSKLKSEKAQLEAQIAALSSSQPSVDGGGIGESKIGTNQPAKTWNSNDAAARFRQAMKSGIPK